MHVSREVFFMKRVVIVGASSSGKTSLAKIISKKKAIPHIEMDNFFWLPEWKRRPFDEFKNLVVKAIEKPEWVLCGNQSKIIPMLWGAADTIIWLDYPLRICLCRGFKRCMRLLFNREQCCNGNYESFSRAFFSKESIFLYIIKGHKKKKERYPQLMKDPRYKDKTFIRLRSPNETKKWVEKLS